MNERYFLDQDEDGHWCLVKESKRMSWVKWLAQPEPKLVPDFVMPLGYHPNKVTFELPYAN